MYNFYPKNSVQPPGRTPKILLVMKLTTLMLITVILHVSASTFAQKITLTKRNAPLNKVFESISNQSDYDFLVSTESLKQAKPVTINVQNEELKLVLNKIFSGQPLTFVIQDKMVVVSKKEPSTNEKVTPINVTTLKITGKVTDTTGKVLPGASIKVKGTTIFSTTDENGMFSLTNVPLNSTIEISFIGYQTETITVNSSNQFIIILKTEQSKLNEVQVIGYGQTTKRLNTGNVSTIKAADIENEPITNLLAALQGRAPGVLVQTQNGLPGGNIKIQIRGQGSLASGTDPLYVIDGIPFLSAPLYGNGIAAGANGAISPFSIINPGDIESMSILKDADATAIYGSRGANGVILITTKKGNPGKDNFTISADAGISRISRNYKYLNLQQYLKLRNQAFKNDNIIPTPDNAPDLTVWDTTKSTDWQKNFYGGTAHVTNIQTSLTGGDAHTHYLASLNYHNEGSILPGDLDYKKGGGYLNIEHTSSDNKLSTSLTVNYNKDDNHTLYSFGDSGGSLPPNFPVFNPDGTYNWSIDNNPVASLGQRQNSKTSYLNFNTLIKYSIFSGFDAKISAGYNNYALDQTATLPAAAQDANYSPTDVAYFATSNSERYIIEPQLNFIKHIKNSVFSVLLGATYQHIQSTGTNIEGDGVSNPSLLGNLGAATSIIAKSNSYTDYKYESVYGRLNYNLLQKYIVDINLRRDGSSRFGPGKQFGNFYAIGAGWLFTQEDFFKDNLSVISYGKLRGSYGLTGNDQIADYQYLSTYNTGTNYGGISSLSPARVANPSYSWETTKKLEFAAELGFLKDRILFTGAWYKNTSGNQLIAYTIPYLSGFASYQANFPAVVENKGFEFELNTQIIKENNFSWNASFNLTIPQNKLVSFPGITTSSYANAYVIGQDLSIVKAYQLLGVDPNTGLALYKDVNGDGKLSFQADAVVAGYTSPKLFGGFSNSFTFKGIQLDVLFEFIKRSLPGYYPALGTSALNDPLFVTNRWEKPGDVKNIPGARTDAANFQYSTAEFSDASYIRLKNLALSYDLKSSVLKQWKIKGMKIFIQGQNLFVWANDKRFDPEISSSTGAIPLLKTLTAGMKLTF
jgi:TonB-linked SusC/RagA family outer membrane protein